MENSMRLEIRAISINEAFASSAVAAFALPLEPTLTELSDIKTAVSEAVTNCVVHAYPPHTDKAKAKIVIECEIKTLQDGGILHITVTDFGKGIENVDRAVLPFYTTLEDEERSGMGFTIMQTFMNDFSIESGIGQGVKIKMMKRIGGRAAEMDFESYGEGVDA